MISAIITSSVLIVVIILLRAIFHGKISSRLQYMIWGLVLIRVLLPFPLLPSSMSVMNVVESAGNIDSTSESVTTSTEIIHNKKNISVQAAPTQTTGNTSNKPTFSQTSENIQVPFEKSLTIVWVCGMLIVSLWFTITNIRFYTKLRRQRKRFAVLHCKLPVYIVDDLYSPCLFGVLRPVIYLTSQAVKDEETLHYVLTHEQTHYAHKDHIWAFLRSIALILHWFNPLMWIGANLSKTDCELACDETTIKKLGEENRIRYGQILVSLISINGKPSDLLCTSTAMTFGKSEMKNRIMMITKKPKTFRFALIAVGIIIIITALCTFTGASNFMKSEAETVTSKRTSKEILLQKLKSELPEGSVIAASYIDDFNKDNKLEMFGLVNTGKETADGIFDDQVWYIDESGTKKMFQGSMYPDTATIWDVGKQKLFYLEEASGGSGSLSHVWSVKKGRPYELEHAGQMLEYAGNLQFYTYPSAFDLKPDGTGHTWKRYYLYFDETTGTFKEYGGISISKADLLKRKGASEILDDIRNKGYKITDIFYRENGIININYNDGTYNLNITLTIKNKSVSLDEQSSIENPNYDQGGIYKNAIFKDIATYPKNFSY
jgi:Antirepressor regulating drug resistance, predicted signal transduction N-terminal membrane component